MFFPADGLTQRLPSERDDGKLKVIPFSSPKVDAVELGSESKNTGQFDAVETKLGKGIIRISGSINEVLRRILGDRK